MDAPAWLGRVAAGALIAAVFVVMVVNIGIYWARWAYIGAHPLAVGLNAPTISRAISDPLVGETFAFWIAIAAPVLFLGVAGIVAIWLVAAGVAAPVAPRTAAMLRICGALVVVLQVFACIGMVTLSQYTFPKYHDEHMLGSYVFFGAQAGAVLGGLAMSFAVAADRRGREVLVAAGLLHPLANRLRLLAGTLAVAAVAAYSVLFFAKDMDSGSWEGAIYAAYVTTEPLCISSFLLFVLLYTPDLARIAWRYRRAPVAEGQGA